MNINVHLPEQFLERLMSAIERIATAAERIAGPVLAQPEPEVKPYAPSYWELTTNAQLNQIAEEDRREQAGYGREYRSAIEAALPKPLDGSDGKS